MTDNASTETKTETTETTETETKTFTQEDVDRIVQERLAQAKRKTDKELEDQRKKAQEQADLDKLQGEERLKKEHELERAKLAEERDAYHRELRLARAESMLATRGLDPKFAPNMIGQTDEDTKANIDALEKLVADAVAAKTKSALSKGAPPAGSGASTKSSLMDMARKAAGLKS